jgi:hypothetical protein
MKKYENLAKAIYDIGKYSFTALVVGQFVSQKLSVPTMAVGFIFTIIAFWIALRLERVKEENRG